jgi:quinol monooxygenase YgiN
MSFVLVVKMLAQEGNEGEAAATMVELAEATRKEPGCEQYVDKAAFEAHGASPHFQELALGKLFGLMESRERSFYETL